MLRMVPEHYLVRLYAQQSSKPGLLPELPSICCMVPASQSIAWLSAFVSTRKLTTANSQQLAVRKQLAQHGSASKRSEP